MKAPPDSEGGRHPRAVTGVNDGTQLKMKAHRDHQTADHDAQEHDNIGSAADNAATASSTSRSK